MSIQEQGIKGEKLARLFIKRMKFNNLMQLDWVAERDGKYFQFEIKCKEHFKAPPFDGHGLNKYQYERRLKFFKATGIRCGFIIFDKDKIYYQWLDVLGNGEKHETRNGIILFPLTAFNVLWNSNIPDAMPV